MKYLSKLRSTHLLAVAIALSIGTLTRPLEAQREADTGASSYPSTREGFDALMSELSNWGRWGPNDQLGTLNLISPEKRKQALSLAKDGISISLARNIDEKNGASPAKFLFQPILAEGSQAERLLLDYHGTVSTHLDSLNHMFYRGRMYNGFAQEPPPSRLLGVENNKNGILTRGILIDIPRLRGVPYLEPGTAVRCEELDAWLKRANLRVGAGDALFLRTGRGAYEARHGLSPKLEWSGLDLSCARWLKKHDVAVLGSDYANELSNDDVQRRWLDHAPFHLLGITSMGMSFIDNCDLERLADEAERRKKWEFLLTVSPLPIPGATGSIVNPVAVF